MTALAELLHNPLLWRGTTRAGDRHASTGFPELDHELPGPAGLEAPH
jgi:hypothetical protein